MSIRKYEKYVVIAILCMVSLMAYKEYEKYKWRVRFDKSDISSVTSRVNRYEGNDIGKVTFVVEEYKKFDRWSDYSRYIKENVKNEQVFMDNLRRLSKKYDSTKKYIDKIDELEDKIQIK